MARHKSGASAAVRCAVRMDVQLNHGIKTVTSTAQVSLSRKSKAGMGAGATGMRCDPVRPRRGGVTSGLAAAARADGGQGRG